MVAARARGGLIGDDCPHPKVAAQIPDGSVGGGGAASFGAHFDTSIKLRRYTLRECRVSSWGSCEWPPIT